MDAGGLPGVLGCVSVTKEKHNGSTVGFTDSPLLNTKTAGGLEPLKPQAPPGGGIDFVLSLQFLCLVVPGQTGVWQQGSRGGGITVVHARGSRLGISRVAVAVAVALGGGCSVLSGGERLCVCQGCRCR